MKGYKSTSDFHVLLQFRYWFMQIQVNGENRTFESVETVQDLLDELRLEGRIAVEVNRSIIPRSQFQTFRISQGDSIEIVRAIGGG